MQEAKRKLKKVKPLVKMRQMEMEKASLKLIEIREEKKIVVQKMRESQQSYMIGVEKLNQMRTGSDFSILSTMESGLDYLRSVWIDLFKEIKIIESKENAQLHQLTIAQNDLLAAEKLEEKYYLNFQKVRANKQQLMDDEMSVQRYSYKKNKET